MRVLLVISFLVATWRWGDWRNWTKYQSTILFYTLGALLYNVLLYNYPMWEYKSDTILPNHTLSALVDGFIAFPCTVLLYLPHFPKTRLKQVAYILMWGVIYSIIEWVMFRLQLITYHHGWSYVCSILFSFGIFCILVIHHKKPLLAYGISLMAVFCLLWCFKVPFSSMK